MLRRDFYFDLPLKLIAQKPLQRRDASRLLCLTANDKQPRDFQFNRFDELLNPGDLLVMNDTQVIPARLYGRKSTGGKVEVLLERSLDQQQGLVQLRASRLPGSGAVIDLAGGYAIKVLDRQDHLFTIQSMGDVPLLAIFYAVGHIPLPPYIRRPDNAQDSKRYQTVYARSPGSVAAPTAGLHFDQAMLRRLKARGVNIAYISLHIGAGTFQPVRTERIDEHQLHSERFEISQAVVDRIVETKASDHRVVAVGTTSVRALEAAAQSGILQASSGESDIFIYPGYQFKVVDSLLTNFHLPESSLLMLVSAFGGHERVMAAYRHAVLQGYRFFSYGDAMFVEPEAV